MTETTPASAPEVLVERLFNAIVGTLEVASVHLGGRLGLYRALANGPAATSTELAGRTGTAERYVREWLEQQAVAGFLTVDDPDADPMARRYTLPEAYRSVLVDETDLNYLTRSPAWPSTCSARGSSCWPPIEPARGFRTRRTGPISSR
jgi:hypothetical protein